MTGAPPAAHAAQAGPVQFAELAADGRPLRIEYQWIQAPDGAPGPRPLIVFLHEGLGSRAMWREHPLALCAAAGCDGLVYSRPGYGRSTPRAPGEHWAPDFMHRQARELLPALLQALDVDAARRPLWLYGHSDGGSIALLYAAAFPQALAGAIVLAPHILVEDVSIASIEQARQAWQRTDLRQRLARYHDDPDSAFGGWNGIWLAPEFRRWTIQAELPAITCPLLAVQGLDDEYGTLAQIHGIAAQVPQTQLLALPQCGHSPHRDQPQALTAAVADFITRHTPGDKRP